MLCLPFKSGKRSIFTIWTKPYTKSSRNNLFLIILPINMKIPVFQLVIATKQ